MTLVVSNLSTGQKDYGSSICMKQIPVLLFMFFLKAAVILGFPPVQSGVDVLMQPHSGRSVTVPWTLKSLIIFATDVTGTSSYLKMVSQPLVLLRLVCYFLFDLLRQSSVLRFLSWSVVSVVKAVT